MQSMKRVAGQGGTRTRFLHAETVTDATGVPVLIENTGATLLVGVDPGDVAGDTARVEFSLSDLAALAADTATWHPWTPGDVSALTYAELPSNVMALRLVSVGIGTWEAVT